MSYLLQVHLDSELALSMEKKIGELKALCDADEKKLARMLPRAVDAKGAAAYNTALTQLKLRRRYLSTQALARLMLSKSLSVLQEKPDALFDLLIDTKLARGVKRF